MRKHADVTFYAYDVDRQALLAMWSTGRGNVVHTVTALPPATPEPAALDLAQALTDLSAVTWRTYTHPASAAASPDADSEDWPGDEEREAFDDVMDAIRKPNLPVDGMLMQSYIAVEEAAHRVGRILSELGDAPLEPIAADVAAELAAVEQAERGDLSGRAQQAVKLTRADASPLQVAAADALLRATPLGSEALFIDVDPTAASVAAAHWLQAAAQVAADATGIDPVLVVAEADSIEAIAVRTPTLVLERLDGGETPRDIVTELVADAMAVANGQIPDLAGLLGQIVDAEERAQQYGDRADEFRQALMPDRITPLDPARPAQDLLEDLLSGIRGCWLLYRDDEADEAGASPDDADDDVRDERFFDAVRAIAAAGHDRLL
jgi:hypothetical protein